MIDPKPTHLLRCAHAIGLSRYEYSMPCIVLGKTKSGRTKIRVFGNRYWKNTSHRSRIRYVWGSRLYLIKEAKG